MPHQGSRRVTSATAAYRKDLRESGRSSFGASDDAWLTVASVLEVAAGQAEGRDELFAKAARVAIADSGRPTFRRLVTREYGEGWTDIEAIALVIMAAQEAGAFNLAAAIVDMMLAAAPPAPLQHGRLLALRARVSYKLGQKDRSETLFRRVDALGRQSRHPELRMRALQGLGTRAQVRGNYPSHLDYIRRPPRLCVHVPPIGPRHPLHFRFVRHGLQL